MTPRRRAATPKPKEGMRGWLVWSIGGVWLLTALAVLAATRFHPATAVDIALSVSKFSFSTDAQGLAIASDERQLQVSGAGSLHVRLSGVQDATYAGAPLDASSLEIEGEPYATCSFYHVRSSGVELADPSVVTMEAPSAARSAFSLLTHGSLSGTFTSRPAAPGLNPGFTCDRVRVNGGPAGEVEGSFSPRGGGSVFLAATSDVRLDFVLAGQFEIHDTQVPVLETLRFWEVEPGSSQEKTVLLKGRNEVTFEKLEKKITLDEADLLEVVPRRGFYLRRFTVKDGIQLSLSGIAADVRVGAGARDMATRMPSLFDHLDNTKRIYGVIPALAALILGILDRMGVLQKK